MVIVDVRKDVIVVRAVLSWMPDHLHGFVAEPHCLVLVVDTGKEPGVEAKLTENGSIT